MEGESWKYSITSMLNDLESLKEKIYIFGASLGSPDVPKHSSHFLAKALKQMSSIVLEQYSNYLKTLSENLVNGRFSDLQNNEQQLQKLIQDIETWNSKWKQTPNKVCTRQASNDPPIASTVDNALTSFAEQVTSFIETNEQHDIEESLERPPKRLRSVEEESIQSSTIDIAQLPSMSMEHVEQTVPATESNIEEPAREEPENMEEQVMEKPKKQSSRPLRKTSKKGATSVVELLDKNLIKEDWKIVFRNRFLTVNGTITKNGIIDSNGRVFNTLEEFTNSKVSNSRLQFTLPNGEVLEWKQIFEKL